MTTQPYGSFAVTLTDPVGACRVTPDGESLIELFPASASVFGVDLTPVLERLALPEANVCAECGAGVGHVLAGPADERVEWVPAVVAVGVDAPVSVLCETCA